MNDRSDLLVLRPRRPAPPPPGGSGAAKSGLLGAPPAWLPPGLQELYSRTSTLPKPQAGARSSEAQQGLNNWPVCLQSNCLACGARCVVLDQLPRVAN